MPLSFLPSLQRFSNSWALRQHLSVIFTLSVVIISISLIIGMLIKVEFF